MLKIYHFIKSSACGCPLAAAVHVPGIHDFELDLVTLIFNPLSVQFLVVNFSGCAS